MKTIKELMHWRFACQNFDDSRKIKPEDLQELLETAHLAPSSYGLQAWKMVVVLSHELRQKLAPACNNQAQITEASALIFFCARTDLLGEKGVIQRYVDFYQKAKNKTQEEADKFRNKIIDYVEKLGEPESFNWLQKQVYLPVETLMLAAAEKEIDSCPMEGFDTKKVAKLLKLEENLYPTVIVALGYRKVKEQPQKVRMSMSEIVDFRK
jgi:nitroreductase